MLEQRPSDRFDPSPRRRDPRRAVLVVALLALAGLARAQGADRDVATLEASVRQAYSENDRAALGRAIGELRRVDPENRLVEVYSLLHQTRTEEHARQRVLLIFPDGDVPTSPTTPTPTPTPSPTPTPQAPALDDQGPADQADEGSAASAARARPRLRDWPAVRTLALYGGAGAGALILIVVILTVAWKRRGAARPEAIPASEKPESQAPPRPVPQPAQPEGHHQPEPDEVVLNTDDAIEPEPAGSPAPSPEDTNQTFAPLFEGEDDNEKPKPEEEPEEPAPRNDAIDLFSAEDGKPEKSKPEAAPRIDSPGPPPPVLHPSDAVVDEQDDDEIDFGASEDRAADAESPVHEAAPDAATEADWPHRDDDEEGDAIELPGLSAEDSHTEASTPRVDDVLYPDETDATATSRIAPDTDRENAETRPLPGTEAPEAEGDTVFHSDDETQVIEARPADTVFHSDDDTRAVERDKPSTPNSLFNDQDDATQISQRPTEEEDES